MLTVRSIPEVKAPREKSPAKRTSRAKATDTPSAETSEGAVARADEARSEEPARNATALALLDATEALLAEGGMRALSARAIAERAGVRKGLVFYYWPSTDALFEEVLGRYYKRHSDALAAAFATEGDVRTRLHRMIDAYLDFMETHHAYARVVQEQIATGGPHVELVRAHLIDVLSITTRALEGVLPKSGPLAMRHFHLSLSALVINYFTYGPVLGKTWWGKDPLGARGLSERRDHVHWVIDAWLGALGLPAATST
ncbi:MAG: TetR/AcrR family transcriptional regulator [Sandaracinus sp.]|nr:TetR/AcrR family transcriptional regulator [Sandaracinus sp.]